MTCLKCGEALPDDSIFCEACGERLVAPETTPPAPETAPPFCLCGAPESELDPDGFCLECGRRCRPAREDHIEIEISTDFAAVSDKGKQHARNEDRVRLHASADRQIAVICDGVSNSSNPDAAAAAASESAVQVLAKGGTLKEALQEAALQVKSLGHPHAEVCPSSTIVAAVIAGGQVELAWLGDSRAYWIGESGDARPLTRDHSWMNEVVAAGEMSAAEAAQAPMAHGITRWLGADAGEMEPETAQFQIPGSGWLLLCTDGLWNYAEETAQMENLVTGYAKEDASALSVAKRLVDFANSCGGRDNITAAIAVQRKHGE